MLQPYLRILRLPGALGFSAAGLLARLEISMVGLGSVLLVQRTTGSYGLGGAVAAGLGLSAAAMSPVLAGLVDRYGQRRVLRPAVAVHVVALLALIAAGTEAAPLPVLLAAAVLAGVSQVGVGSLVRARWAVLLAGTPGLQTAFALEAVLDEVVFIVGPIVVALLATFVHPAAGLLLATVAALVGVLLLAAQRRTEPPASAASGAAPRERWSAPAARGMAVLIAVFLAAGGIFGSAEVAVVAATRAAGVPAASGLVLALWATGSMLSGLVYGAVHWRGRQEVRFTRLVVLLAVLTAPMALTTAVPVLAVVFFVAGLAIAPVVTTGASLVERIAPTGRLTQGLALTGTALGLTYAAAAAVGGVVIDAAGPGAGFLVPVGCAAAGAVAAVLGFAPLRAAVRVDRGLLPAPA